jgi:hypothetical protein
VGAGEGAVRASRRALLRRRRPTLGVVLRELRLRRLELCS